MVLFAKLYLHLLVSKYYDRSQFKMLTRLSPVMTGTMTKCNADDVKIKASEIFKSDFIFNFR